jgi:hypothetical protein
MMEWDEEERAIERAGCEVAARLWSTTLKNGGYEND